MQGGRALLCAALFAGLAALAWGSSGLTSGNRVGPGQSDGLTRPLRPAVFHTPEELRHYLDAVSNYYAVASRPGRFGKRASGWSGAAAAEAGLGLGGLEGLDLTPDAESLLERMAPRRLHHIPSDADEAQDYIIQLGPAATPPSNKLYQLVLDQRRGPALEPRPAPQD